MTKRRLGDICNVVSGSTPKTNVEEFWDGDIKWITPAELTEDSYVLEDSARKITELAVEKTGLNSFPKGTVILSSRAPIGKVAIAGCEMYCNQGFKNLICTEEIYNEYLYWFLKSKKDYLNSLGRGATFKEISKSIVENIEVEVPKVEVQKEIAYQLQKCREILALRRKELFELDQLIKSRFVELFGDPSTNSKGYPEKLLPEIAEYWNGLTYKPEDVSDEGTIVLRSSNIQNAALDFADIVRVNCKIGEKKYVQDNDILMCSRNGSARLVGKVALIKGIKEPMSFGAFMMIIRSTYYPYLVTYFQLPAFRAQITTGATTTINQITGRMLDVVKLPVPDLDTINEFTSFVHQVDKLKFLLIISQRIYKEGGNRFGNKF